MVNLRMIENSFPCKCGHNKKEHEHRGHYYSTLLQDICHECLILKYKIEDKSIKEYHTFQPDNLKYLEKKNREK